MAPKMGPVKATVGTLELKILGLMPGDPKVPVGGLMQMTMKIHIEGEFNKGGKDYKMVVDVRKSRLGAKELIK
jgi:hypothetical protein